MSLPESLPVSLTAQSGAPTRGGARGRRRLSWRGWGRTLAAAHLPLSCSPARSTPRAPRGGRPRLQAVSQRGQLPEEGASPSSRGQPKALERWSDQGSRRPPDASLSCLWESHWEPQSCFHPPPLPPSTENGRPSAELPTQPPQPRSCPPLPGVSHTHPRVSSSDPPPPSPSCACLLLRGHSPPRPPSAPPPPRAPPWGAPGSPLLLLACLASSVPGVECEGAIFSVRYPWNHLVSIWPWCLVQPENGLSLPTRGKPGEGDPTGPPLCSHRWGGLPVHFAKASRAVQKSCHLPARGA